jgi:hypothetical protein
MPYLKHDWMIDTERLGKGTWVPERNWDRWQQRANNISTPWRRHTDMTSPPPPLADASLAVLASDIGSAQRDGFIYTNFIERLKNAPSDTTADEVVEQLRTLGFASADWPEAVGGPPPHESPRPVGKVLDWLFEKVAEVGKFLLDCVNFVMTTLTPLNFSAVALGISLPPSVSFEFPPKVFKDPPEWKKARDFVDKVIAELGERAFSS